eukprot:CAMPEP_0174376400 /NCGR_PEP_ID=MMETSP0811_2-20130205/118083_1 /TAXON_ID=73025 ORGANISM="Eutreptiella gymnastica-like, Strain CCMP1594" /NCGR_SAMPLE_ID=MMETSP0811_2 /ASSEMBLY_ACC=CAM_ASM_000667 /LENGTH=124 /DNA_ID=CAMNT_0015527565 /DNA_START=399 /DNA_END=769 /DNA_ORIENTATION=+
MPKIPRPVHLSAVDDEQRVVTVPLTLNGGLQAVLGVEGELGDVARPPCKLAIRMDLHRCGGAILVVPSLEVGLHRHIAKMQEEPPLRTQPANGMHRAGGCIAIAHGMPVSPHVCKEFLGGPRRA